MVERASITARAIASQKRFNLGGVVPENTDNVNKEEKNTDPFLLYLQSVKDSPVADRVDEAAARDYYHNPDAYDQSLPYAVQTELDRIRAHAKRYANLRERQQKERQQGLAGRRFEAAQPLESPYDVEGPTDPSVALRRYVVEAINRQRKIQKGPLEVA